MSRRFSSAKVKTGRLEEEKKGNHVLAVLCGQAILFLFSDKNKISSTMKKGNSCLYD
jgi:hypothetical protein